MEDNAPTWTQAVSFISSATAEHTLFYLYCKNVPVGSAVSFYADNELPDGQKIDLPITPVMKSSSFQAGVSLLLPANFKTTMHYSWYSNGHAPLPGFNIAMCAAIMVQAGEDILHTTSI